MRKCLLFQFLFFLIIGYTQTNAQTLNVQRLDSFSGSFIKQVRSIDKEKAYLVTDKSIYTTGEPIWFRSFLLHNISKKISVQSNFLFVDLVNENDQVLVKSILNSKQQQTNGKLTLSDTLSTGYYFIRAYTKSMAEKDSFLAAVVPLYVINPTNPVSYKVNDHKKGPVNNQSVYLEMFPEGGNLVTGINTSIAFYLHDELGNPLSQTISIKDNRDSIVSTCTSDNNGLSKSEFFPYFFRKYKAVVFSNGKEYDFPLPGFNRFAAQLSMISDNGSFLKLRTILEDSIYKKEEVTYLLGISADSLCFAGVGYGSYETDVLKTKFPGGIATFILFDKNFNYLSERNIYIKEDNVILKTDLNKTTYSKRSNAILTTVVLNNNNLPVNSSLSISVADSNSIITNNNFSVATIIQNAKFGTINDWNLIHLNSVSETDKDILMLCRPSFYRSLKAQSANYFKQSEDSLFYIKGTVLDAKGQPLNNKILNLLYLADNNSFFTDTSDNAGRFSFPIARYMDSTQFAVQISDMKGRPTEQAKIRFDNLPVPQFSTPSFLKRNLELPPLTIRNYARFHTDTNSIGNGKDVLRPVQVNAKAKNFYDHSQRMSLNTSVLNSKELLKLGMGNIGIGILRLPGIQLINGYVLINGLNDTKGVNASSEPMVLLDGAQISVPPAGEGAFSSPVIQYLNTLNPRELEFIEVIKGTEASIYGLRSSNGVISIHTSSDIKQDFVSDDSKGTIKFYRQGIAKPYDYPQITYDQKKGKDLSFIDARSTLYWKGNVITTDSQPLKFNFTTNDIPGHYKIIITGVTIHGDLIYQTLSFTNL